MFFIKKDPLERFVRAQNNVYAQAKQELTDGCKITHWMWFIFPQLKGLGYSSMAEFYGVKNREEAEAYIQHPILGPRLIELSKILLALKSADVSEVFGYPDDMKLKSSMTLFYLASNNLLFKQVLDKFFNGEYCEFTVKTISTSD